MISQRPNKRNLAAVVAAALLILFFLTFYIWHHAESVNLGYSTRDLEEQIKQLAKDIEDLEAKKAALLSLEKVDQVAREKLGMAPPEDDQIIYERHDPLRGLNAHER